LADHASDLLFAPTEKSMNILLGEDVEKEKVSVTGNTIVDSVIQNKELADRKSRILKTLNLKKDEYFLVTAHRQENVDDKERLSGMLSGFEKLSDKYNIPIIYPIHPRTRKMIDKLGLGHVVEKIKNLKLIDPVGFLDFLQLESNAKLVLTDSGGVQEETCILKVPCVTLRDNTERPETLEVGSNILAGCDAEKIIECAEIMLDKERHWKNPFGDGTSGKRIVEICEEDIEKANN
ncbi:MAG: UDP-N-acetylglucosamine 2-epimerase (non-hydrolyzing), partial [Nanohaloarchaea archaeon]|nr:UDP-N-acetylglucosamine 2-epimerase (non-hydrolyzing) [Candidatus Nanohaloarchaea archaeon]